MPRIAPKIIEPLIFAHRGASALAPDNTIESFRLGLELGANGLESDVWLSADGHAVLSHDDNVGSLLRRRRISRTPAGELPDQVPTLARLFDELGTGFELSLDIKDPEAFDATLGVLRDISAATGDDMVGRTWLCHPSLDRVAAWRRTAPDVRLVHSTRLDRLARTPEQHGRSLAEAAVDAVNFRFDDWNGGLTTLYHRFDLFCFGWDAQLVRVATELLDCGVDGVYGNHVDRLLDARRAVWGY